MNTQPTSLEMQKAFQDRDASYDGVFFTGVRTTGIFCRPSCPARKPKPEHVEYFQSSRDALVAGFRPCKRCRPMDTNGRPPDWVERLIQLVDTCPTRRITDSELRAVSIEPARARRYFRSHYGMTFQAYHRMRRLGLALSQIQSGGNLLATGFDHGFDSPSGFRDAFAQLFGKPPGRARNTECMVMKLLPSPLGRLIAAATDEGICMLEFADRRGLATQLATLRRRLRRAIVPGENHHLDLLATELCAYFDGSQTTFTVPLIDPGSPFQRLVWDKLREIPYGTTCSYEQIALAIGRPGAQRAVGRANGDNRMAILVPCHRVVQKNGALRGYAGGLWRKQFLLDHERKMIARGAAVPARARAVRIG